MPKHVQKSEGQASKEPPKELPLSYDEEEAGADWKSMIAWIPWAGMIGSLGAGEGYEGGQEGRWWRDVFSSI